MTYHLGVDLGTTYTAAAVRRDGRSEMITLGNRAAVIPSVVFLRDDGTVLVGEAASRRGLTEPGGVAREFKRRFGDPTPLLLGGSPQSPEALTARLLRWVVDTVTEREGGGPASIALTHPANWGEYKRDLLRQAVRLADLADVRLISEPEAAAVYYGSLERLDPGTVVAVYDLGGGTFDAVVLRKKLKDGFEILGEPEGIERLGGVDFDEAVFRHVLAGVAAAGSDLDDPAALAALTRLREECVVAKESLSSDTDVSIPVLLPNVQTEVRLTRDEFESMIRPTLVDTLAAMRRAQQSAGVASEDIDRVLLVGGSSRIPLVSEMIAGDLGRPVALDAQPKHAVALGASIAAEGSSDVGPVVPTPPIAVANVVAPVAARPDEAPALPVAGDLTTTRVPALAADTGDDSSSRSPVLLAMGVFVALAIVAAIVVFATRGDDGAADQATAVGVTTGVTVPVGTAAETSPPPDTTVAPVLDVATTASPTTAPTTAPTTTLPPGPYVEIIAIERQGDRYVTSFSPHEFEPAILGELHVHLFWDSTDRSAAGTNGVPQPGEWLIWDVPSVVDDPYFAEDVRPSSATAICALVADVEHAIADVDGDGVMDPMMGNCLPLP